MKSINLVKVAMSSHFLIKRALIVSILILLNYQNLFSQCKLERINDDFGTGSAIYSKDVNLASVFPIIGTKKPWDLVMSFMLVDGTITITITHQSQKYSSFLNSIFFKFKDGTVLKMEAPSTTGDYNTGLGYSYKYTGFSLNKEELELFASKDLSKFQADFKFFPDYPLVEEDIKDKNVNKIRKDAGCILEEFNNISKSNFNKEDIKEIKDVADYKCAYEMDKKDSFTKQRSVLTKAAVFFDSKEDGIEIFFQVCGSNIDGNNGLKFFYCITADQIAKSDEALLKPLVLFDQVEILLENDESINLETNEISDYVHQAARQIWSYKLFTIDNDSSWNKLKSIPLQALRVSMVGKELFTNEVDQKFAKSIMNVINCIDSLEIKAK